MPKQECILKIEKKTQIKAAAHPLATRGNAATISSLYDLSRYRFRLNFL